MSIKKVVNFGNLGQIVGNKGQRQSKKVTSPPQATFKEVAIKIACVIRSHETYFYKIIDVSLMDISG